MRRHTRKGIMVLGAALLVGMGAVLMTEQCDRLWAQNPPQNATQEPVKAVLSDVERLTLVNAYQAAVLAAVDLRDAQARVQRTGDVFNSLQTDLKGNHKWPAATTFEINGETGKVLVHLPPTVSQPPSKGTKEQ